MEQSHGKNNHLFLTPFRIVALYAAVGGLWIIFSDTFVNRLAADQATLSLLQTAKGWFFVAATAGLLHLLISRLIRKLRLTDNELRRSEEKFATVFRSSPAAIAVSSFPDGRFLEVNQSFAHLSGYRPDEVIGRTSLELDLWCEPADRERYLKTLQEGGETREMSMDFRRKSGETMNALISGGLIYINGDAQILSVVLDISDRVRAEKSLRRHQEHLEELVGERTAEVERSKAALVAMLDEVTKTKNELTVANEKLRELDRLKSMFIASMSHELRTPLNSIIGFSGILLQGMSGEINDEQRDQLGRIFRSGKHLLALITDVIDIAKVESGKVEPFCELVDLHLLVEEAVEQVSQQATEKGLLIKRELPAGELGLRTDRKRLLQCLLNYLSNAVKFTEAGVVTIAVRYPQEEPGMLEIYVQDTGAGIGPEDQERLFHSFARLENRMKTSVPGTGLGLYLTKKLVTEVLGGRVGVESREGEGSRFWLRVPSALEVE